MAYNLYQVQMARAWQERIEKENAQAEKFWSTQALQGSKPVPPAQYSSKAYNDAATVVSTACPSGFTSKTSYLKGRLERLEQELALEREHRQRVEQELQTIKTGTATPPKPSTPTGRH